MGKDQSPVPESQIDLKSAYYESKFNSSKKFVRALILIVAIFNLGLLIPDLMLVGEASQKMGISIIRAAFSLILIVFFLKISAIKKFKVFYLWLTFCEFFSLAVFLFVFANYENPNILIQAMGMMIVIIVIFLISSKWIQTLVVALTGETGFLVCALARTDFAAGMEFWVCFVYMVLTLLLCAITAKNTDLHQFREFVAKRELERLSCTDFLTDTVNRFKFVEEAERWMGFCKRQKLPLSLVFIDVDNLKTINDGYGHLTGDFVLSNLAKTIRSKIRDSDILARWGGDEFILLLPNVSQKNAAMMIERIRDDISQKPVIEGMSVTCCFGVAAMKETSSFEGLVNEADGLMYAGKKNGKNNIQQSV